MSDLDYVYAVARIRVKEKSLLNDADIRQMTGMKDEREVLNFLADRGWGDGSTPPDADRMLATEEEKTWKLMHELKISPQVFEVLSYPKLYHNLKAGIKEICTSDRHGNIFYEMDRFGGAEMVKVLEEKNFAALPAHMRAAAERAYDVMLTTNDGQMCDVIVDRACMMACLEAGRKSKNRLLKDYEESTVAVTNIKIAVRCMITGKSMAFLKEALAPCGAFDVNALALAATKGRDALYEYLEGHGFSEASEALKESSSAFERWCDNRVIDTILPQKMNSVSAGPVIAYYLARENELKNVRIIVTAKANGFSEDSTRERVRKTYG
uniref:Archaeal/vacuolar-type H+-ATPase subunit C n=1 Tax=Eubacterium cellulosolvens (strain ATCC 43171 / JCM 9499 / 6) TaxID=633697 RepID=I5AVR4_EUBC6